MKTASGLMEIGRSIRKLSNEGLVKLWRDTFEIGGIQNKLAFNEIMNRGAIFIPPALFPDREEFDRVVEIIGRDRDIL